MNPRPFTVVVADDSEDMRELLVAALQTSGRFEVVARASDGAGALRATTEHAPDLLLLDLGMPRVGGLDVLSRLAATAPDTRVVVVSGFPRGTLADVTGARGAVGYVEKGLSPRAMISEIIAVAGVVEAVQACLAERRTQLARHPRSSAAARRFVGETLRRWACEDVLDTVTLLVSELVANSVIHARSAADVAVRLMPETLRLEVSDRSDQAPSPRDAEPDSTSGRGLGLVQSLASSWGVQQTGNGKTVWFEVPRPDRFSGRS